MIPDETVAAEIEGLHRFLEKWFNGDGSADFSRFEDALAEDFVFLPPNGGTVERQELVEGLRHSFGQHGDLRIRIEKPVVRWRDDDACLATYEEWHERPGYTTARRSSVLLTRAPDAPGNLRWHTLHETWIHAPPQRSEDR